MESKQQQQQSRGGQPSQQQPRQQGRRPGRGGGRKAGGRGGGNNNHPATHQPPTSYTRPQQPQTQPPEQPKPQPQPQQQPQQPQQTQRPQPQPQQQPQQESQQPRSHYYAESQPYPPRKPRQQSHHVHQRTTQEPQTQQMARPRHVEPLQTQIPRPPLQTQVASEVSQPKEPQERPYRRQQGPPQQTHPSESPQSRFKPHRKPRQQSQQASPLQTQRPPKQNQRKPRQQQWQQRAPPQTHQGEPVPSQQVQPQPPQEAQQLQQPPQEVQQPQQPPQEIQQSQQPSQEVKQPQQRPSRQQKAKVQQMQQGEIMKRPPSGKERNGKQIRLLCNHFSFLLARTPLYQYSVEFTPECESKKTRYAILQKHKDESIGCSYVFDGAMLFTVAEIKELEFKALHAEREVTVSIVFTKVLYPEGPNAPEQLYNMLFKKILRGLRLKQIGRQHFDPRKSIAIPQHKVELWPGYFTSIGPNKMGSMLIADVTHKILRTDSVLNFLYELIDAGGSWRLKANQELLGQIVLTRYNNRTYRIDEIDWDKTPRSTFVKRNGEHTTFQEYYASTYNKALEDLEQPLLIHRFRRKGAADEIIYLIPELCSMTGLTEKMRKDFRVMQDVAKHTRVPPSTRAQEVISFVQSINSNEEINEELAEWKIKLDPQMLAVQGRVLPAETIMFAGDFQGLAGPSADWSQMTKNAPLIHAVGLVNWLLVCSERNGHQAREFSEKLKTVGKSVGFTVERPITKLLRNDNSAAFTTAIKEGMKAHPDIEFVVCILPTAMKDRYDEIKRICCVEVPVPSQCLLAKSMGKSVMSVCSKIMMQINCKLGGELWNLHIPISNTMVIGIDVYHDTNTRGGKRSVAGFCASINKSFTRYFSRVTFQGRGQELVSGLQSCLHDALRAYFARNQSLPERIIVYRDGVGDGMLDAVAAHEIPQFRETFKVIDEKYNPKMAFVVVKKRIHTRLFSPDPRGGLSNPPPGTVADSGCVHPDWYDFFLVSQSVRQGTVTPSHYHVIVDNTGLQPDQMQVLTYKMCHLYYNWPGTIRVPAPCQYAHKIAFLVGQSLHQDPAPALRDKLYFL